MLKIFRNRQKEICEILEKNLEDNEVFYIFSRIPIESNVVFFDGKSSVLQYGIQMPVADPLPRGPFPFTMTRDIAYEKEGKLYEILTNKEVKIIKEGKNIIGENEILAAANISVATANELNSFTYLMKYKNNAKTVYDEYQKTKKR